MTPHTVLSSEQLGLGSIVRYGCQSWVQCREQRSVTPAPSCAGQHGVDVTYVASATPLCRAVVRLISWEQLNALVERDILSEKLVEAEATGLFVEPALSEAENR